MNSRFEGIKRYTFKNTFKHYSYQHHIDTSKTLDEQQLMTVKELLASFPHCSHDNDWVTRFPKIDFSKYDNELLMLAANAHDGRNPVLHTVCGINVSYNFEHDLVVSLQQLIRLK